MAKPFIKWRVGLNHSLIADENTGPLVLDQTNISKSNFLLARISNSIDYKDPVVDYCQRNGYDENTKSFKINNPTEIPDGLEFDNWEPLFSSLSVVGEHKNFFEYSWHTQFRGFVGGNKNGLNCRVRIKWKDSFGIRTENEQRGANTGICISSYMPKTPELDGIIFDSLFGISHSKRKWTDIHWSYQYYEKDNTAAVFNYLQVLNDINEDTIEVLLSNFDGVKKNITASRIVDGLPVAIYNTNKDFSYSSEDKNNYCLVASIFTGISNHRHINDVYDDSIEHVIEISNIEIDYFEPWVLDVNEFSLRELSEAISGYSTIIPYKHFRKIAPTDLVHKCLGSLNCPENLRISDSDLGVVIEFNNRTYLEAYTKSETCLTTIYKPSSENTFLYTDLIKFGDSFPFAIYGEFKFTDMDQWEQYEKVTIFELIGYEGFELFWSSCKKELFGSESVDSFPANGEGYLNFVFSGSVGVEDVERKVIRVPFNARSYSEKVVNLGIAWTGEKGLSIGRYNNELRIVINSQTKISVILSNLTIDTCNLFSIGKREQTIDNVSFTGFFSSMNVYINALTDFEFVDVFSKNSNIVNSNFEEPGLIKGLSKNWNSNSLQANISAGNNFTNGYFATFNKNCRENTFLNSTELFNYFWFIHCDFYVETFNDLYVSFSENLTQDNIGKLVLVKDSGTIFMLLNIIDKSVQGGGFGHQPFGHFPFGHSLEGSSVQPVWKLVLDKSCESWIDGKYSDLFIEKFNKDIDSHESSFENFSLWSWFGVVGIPWDYSYQFLNPNQGANPVGFNGLYEKNGTEVFVDKCKNDQESTGFFWSSDKTTTGTLFGDKINFPLSITKNKNVLLLADPIISNVVRHITLDKGVYINIDDILSEVQEKWNSQRFSNFIDFGKWQVGNESGLTVGWNRNNIKGSACFAFVSTEEFQYNICRSSLGFGRKNDTEIYGIRKLSTKFSQKSGLISDDSVVFIDQNSLIYFETFDDVDSINEVGILSNKKENVSGFACGEMILSIREKFFPKGWHGDETEWLTENTYFPESYAYFVGGSGPNYSTEKFYLSAWEEAEI